MSSLLAKRPASALHGNDDALASRKRAKGNATASDTPAFSGRALSALMRRDGQTKAVMVNQRALIDKMLARYAQSNAVIRELAQNADDAGASLLRIGLTLAECSEDRRGKGTRGRARGKRVASEDGARHCNTAGGVECSEISVSNDGRTFVGTDWERVAKIAEGNPDENTVGMFGVGFYSVFSMCETPCIRSGGRCLAFHWEGDQLAYATADDPFAMMSGYTTEFVLPLRTPTALNVRELAGYLESALYFSKTLRQVEIAVGGEVVAVVERKSTSARPRTLAEPLGDSFEQHESLQLHACGPCTAREVETLVRFTSEGWSGGGELSTRSRFTAVTCPCAVSASKEYGAQCEAILKKRLPTKTSVNVLLPCGDTSSATAGGGSGGSGGSSSGGEPAAGGGSQSERIELHEIADKVREYTARLAGDTKDVVDTPLELRVFQRDQDDLTLIDLPGMTRMPLKGQHRDIEATITGMYRKYMAPPESVLLNVVNAAVDISTSKSLQMSREMDPDGTRTLVCVTKVDQFTDDRFAEKMRAISSQMDVPLHSVFCVRNRSQAENEQGVPLEEVRVRERELFAQARYAGLAAENKGVPALSTKLVQQQCERIAASLPRAAQQVAARKDELESRLRSLPSVPESSSECREAVQRILSEGSDRLARQLICVPVEARGRGKAAAPSVEELVGRAFVTHISVTPNVVKRAEGEGKVDVSMAEIVQGCEPLQLKLRLNVARRGHTYKRSVSAYATITAHDLKDIDVESVCVEVDCARSGESVGTALDPHGQGLAAIDLSELRADMQLRTVELEFTVVITDVTMRETGNAAEEGSLCSLAHREMAKMAEEVSGLYSGRYFFSDSFRSRVANQCELYAGSAGMPKLLALRHPCRCFGI
eukprot:TRINITY_DN2026_c0_g1_i1.p1 TRINITY_DN2026_c0_g1~~TRINITY_DN2026_c0_g1_i1.p1  ORF type:complete len:883 (+),score=274.58 TRINITY_DN2026_c0_g1_i1:275-2923(+)